MRKILFNSIILILSNSIFANTNLSLKINLKSSLQANEIKLLEAGKFIIKKKFNRNKNWPTYTIIAMINASALESFSIFTSFSLQTLYVPNLIYAKAKQIKPKIVDVSYILDLPWPIPNAKYTNRHTMSKKNGEYFIYWKQIKSTSTDQAIGGAKFIKYKRNKTIVVYNNFLKPSSSIAIFFKSKMKSDTVANLKAVIKTINNWSDKKTRNYEISLKYAKLILSNKIAY